MFIIESIISGMMAIADVIWGWPILILTSFVAVYMTVRLRFFQFRHFGLIMKETFGKVFDKGSGEGNINPFKAACTALASTLGVGNIAGVSVAIATGGPGAVFWMWFIAMLGLIVKFSEVTLAVAYREKDPDTGEWHGGFPWFVKNGLGKKWKWLAKLFAFFGVCVGLFGIGTFSQVNGISSAIHGFFDPNDLHCVKLLPFLGKYSWSVVISSLILAFCVAAVLIGGIKRIANVSQIIVPFMAVIYFLFAAILIITNITQVPAAIKIIVKAAFTPKAVTGGAVGSMFMAMQKGVARGIFSNEAGLGSAPIAAAAAQTKEPVRQGLVSMTGTFIDTIVICTLTGLSIVLTGAWQVDGLEGVAVTTYAFQKGLPFPAEISSFILMLCLVFFAFTTILGWDYYSERCLEYLSGGNMKHVKIYRWIYILAVFIGPYMTVSAVWTIADIFNGLMAVPNMIALFALNGIIVKETKDFFERHERGDFE